MQSIEVLGRIPAKDGTVVSSRLILGKSTVVVEYSFPMEESSGQNTIVKIINTTPEVWTTTVYDDIILDGTYHAWLPIEGFVAPGVEFLTPNPNYTVVFPAAVIGSITCGAYNQVNNTFLGMSSWGPTRLPMMSSDLTALWVYWRPITANQINEGSTWMDLIYLTQFFSIRSRVIKHAEEAEKGEKLNTVATLQKIIKQVAGVNSE